MSFEWIMTAFIFIMMIGLLVLAHELGHYLAAKQTGMLCEEFAIGMGPVMMKLWKKDETQFTIRWLPIGGYVKIVGMNPDEEDMPGGFNSKKIHQRAWVIFAGPFASLLFGYFVFIAVGMAFGIADGNKPTTLIGYVAKNSEAERIGLQFGDKILKINNIEISNWDQMRQIVSTHANKEIDILIQRHNENLSVKAIPKSLDPAKPDDGKLGISPDYERSRVSPIKAIKEGSLYTWTLISEIVKSLYNPKTLKDNVGGPIAIAKYTDQARKQGIDTILTFTAGLSISLGILNLLPIPILDGGHLVLLLVEFLRRGKKLSANAQMAVQMVGLALLGLMLVSVTVMDIGKIKKDMSKPKAVQQSP